MTITIRNHITGEVIRSWNQPGSKVEVLALARQYSVGKHAQVIVTKGLVEVYVVPGVES